MHGSLQPRGELLAVELGAKLEPPKLRLRFDGLFASDLAGRARALGQMTQAGWISRKRAGSRGWNDAPKTVTPTANYVEASSSCGKGWQYTGFQLGELPPKQ